MLQYKKETISEEKEVLKKVICDRCGEQLLEQKTNQESTDPMQKERQDPSYLLPSRFEASFGFLSPLDGENWKAELCEKCSLEVFDFINNGSGPGVETTNWINDGFYSETGYAEPPYDPENYQISIDWKCPYHPEQGQLVLTKEGACCAQDNCPTFFSPLSKDCLCAKEKAGN